ncbi:MAG: glycosyltransferase family 9 protein [Campylobacter sp.]
MKKIIRLLLKKFLPRKHIVKSNLVSMDGIKNVCFFSTTALGDTCFSTAFFRVFRQNFPNVKTTCLFHSKIKPLFKDDPNLDEIMTYNGRWGGFLEIVRALKSKKIDMVFILHSNEPQATPLAVLSGAKYIFKIPNLDPNFNIFHSNSPYCRFQYYVQDRLDELSFVGVKSDDTRMQLFLNEKDYEKVDEILNKKGERKFIGFQLGASGISRRWFRQSWVQLAKKLFEFPDVVIVLTGSQKERVLTDAFCAEFNQSLIADRILNLAGVFDIRSAAALIDRLDCFITPDTGPLHVASALKTPTVALFAAASHITSNPNFDTHIHKFIQKERTCAFCIDKKCKNPECMLQITPDEVILKMREMRII